jgi:hypothetical protein
MSVDLSPLSEINDRAMKVLTRELGTVDALRFINQFQAGSGDYTADRDSIIGDRTVDDIVKEIVSARKSA